MLGLLCAGVLTFVCSSALAGDFDDEPVGLRITLALDRVASFTDTIARGASVAYPLGSSVNPAAYDFLREPPFDFTTVGTLGTNYVAFDTDASVLGLSTTYAHRLPGAGTVSGVFVRTDSHNGDSRQGDEYVLGANEFTLGYSRRLREGLALGASVRLSDSSLDIDDTFLLFARQTDSDSLGVDFTLGVLAAVSEQWLVGLCGGMGWTRSDTEARILFPPPPFGPGLITVDDEFTTNSVNVRGGVGWRPTDTVGIYADWQYLHLDNKLGSVDVGRMFLGAEAFASPVLALRLGGSFDTEQQGTLSAGVGYYGMARVPLELAYSYNPFPEVRREFGRGHMVSLSAVVVF